MEKIIKQLESLNNIDLINIIVQLANESEKIKNL